MKKFILFTTLYLITTISFSQSSDSFFPLAVGNYWEYAWDDGLGGKYTEYIHINSKVQKPNGLNYYLSVSKTIPNQYMPLDSIITFYRIDDSSNIYIYDNKYNKDCISTKLNAKIGERWRSYRFGYDPDSGYLGLSGSIKYEDIIIINNIQKKYKYVEYYYGNFNFIDTKYVEGIGIFWEWYEAYTHRYLLEAHIIQSNIINPSNKDKKSEKFLLSNNYPNPFNPVTNIKLILKEDFRIKLIIYDLLGKKIKTLHEGYLNNGEHLFVWNGKDDLYNDVPSGVYYYRFSVFDKTGNIESLESKKMVLVR